jgi:RimJ/RimL family protein N-acetyltransferase
LGYIELADFDWHSGNAWMGIGIGEREYWGRGFGLEAIRILLKLAFHEWNLQRVSLGVNGYNERAIRAYEKAGFKLEGSLRNYVQRNGKRWDMHMMGVLRREW